MPTKTVKQNGGDYPTLNTALVAANPGDLISIEGSWSIDDTTAATIADDILAIVADADSRHPGYWDESQNHYRLVVSSGSHALTLNGPFTVTVDGLAIEQASTTVSAEGFRCIPSIGYIPTIKNTLIRCSSPSTSQQDCLYTGHDVDIGTVTAENCKIWGANRCGVNSQNFLTSTKVGTVNINSCTIWGCGLNAADADAGGIGATSNAAGNGSGFTVNVHNSIVIENTTGSLSKDYNSNDAGVSCVFNVSYSIDSDNTIFTETDGGAGNLENRTATDDTSPGEGDWVIFEDITISPYDLRIVSNAENDAQDMHAITTAHGLTIPNTDIVGTSRPQNTNYDSGAFEIEEAAIIELLSRHFPRGVLRGVIRGTT